MTGNTLLDAEGDGTHVIGIEVIITKQAACNRVQHTRQTVDRTNIADGVYFDAGVQPRALGWVDARL